MTLPSRFPEPRYCKIRPQAPNVNSVNIRPLILRLVSATLTLLFEVRTVAQRETAELTDAQFRAELARCEACEEKPCKEACPADCSPADFIQAAIHGAPSDYRRAAAIIMGSNPLGGICGAVCPDNLCMKGCVHRLFDRPVNIPPVQSTIIRKAYEAGMPGFKAGPANGKRVAIVGAGPAGLAGAAVLGQLGYAVDIFEKSERAGGMCNLIPSFRLDRKALRRDVGFILKLGDIRFFPEAAILSPARLLAGKEYDAVLVTTGLDIPAAAGIPGEAHAIPWQTFLEEHQHMSVRGKRVLVIGGGAIAVDCAVTASRDGAAYVELVYRRKMENMPLTDYERQLLLSHGVELSTGTRVTRIVHKGTTVNGAYTVRQYVRPGKAASPENFAPSRKEKPSFRACDLIVTAIGSRARFTKAAHRRLFLAGDMVHGAATVVEAVASGKNAAASIDAALSGKSRPRREKGTKSRVVLAGRDMMPVSLSTTFFGKTIISPFLLSAAPHTDGYEQMKKAYDAGWAGGVMKTAFDNVSVHIPGGYMVVFGSSTYGNFDNVSGHPLRRVADEVRQLVREYPDRLTLASTGGPVTGNDAADRLVWQANTKLLEDAGAMGVEYSLSCPQGGDGTAGDVVSQNAELTARIIDWVMEVSDPKIPKLFKLTGAVTSIRAIVLRIREVFGKYPEKYAGITLANSFPAMAVRPASSKTNERGIIVGMSGEGILPISMLTLARVCDLGLVVSGNGGAMDYRSAAGFLALGASTVQFCTVVMKYGLGIIDELHSGLSYLLAERGMTSVDHMIGSSLPMPITPFEELSATKQVPELIAGLCEHCGNCARCPYLAIGMGRSALPVIDPARCIGCSLCVQKCFAGALQMRDRTDAELAGMLER
jgi:NADPH-dependent glutamate synthase beta subunit-like oxidoreductase/dihydroorotate dehydrogenase/Pyruvate/2-oxoacid:ferredoxin oxidoreductase delta subunit